MKKLWQRIKYILWTKKVYIHWHLVMWLLGDELELFRSYSVEGNNKIPAQYVTILDRQHKIPFGLWERKGDVLIRIYD